MVHTIRSIATHPGLSSKPINDKVIMDKHPLEITWWNNLSNSERAFLLNYALDCMGYPPQTETLKVITTSYRLFHKHIR